MAFDLTWRLQTQGKSWSVSLRDETWKNKIWLGEGRHGDILCLTAHGRRDDRPRLMDLDKGRWVMAICRNVIGADIWSRSCRNKHIGPRVSPGNAITWVGAPSPRSSNDTGVSNFPCLLKSRESTVKNSPHQRPASRIEVSSFYYPIHQNTSR